MTAADAQPADRSMVKDTASVENTILEELKGRNPFVAKFAQEIQAILAKYPLDQHRAAVMPLLYLAQREKMFIDRQTMGEIGEVLGISATEVASIVGFYSLYYDQPASKYRIQICTDLPCALRGAEQFLQALCDRLGIKPGETTADGLFTVEPVMCLAACDRAPMFQVQSGQGLAYHENQTVESAMQLIEELRQKAPRGSSRFDAAALGRDGQ